MYHNFVHLLPETQIALVPLQPNHRCGSL